MEKKELRRIILSERTNMDKIAAANFSEKICSKVKHSDIYKNADTIFAYASIRNEVCCDSIIESALKDGKKVALPKVLSSGQDSNMEFFYIASSDETESGFMQIQEPKSTAQPAVPDDTTLIIVPGIVFDRKFHRIGFGKGFYDRYFSKYPCGAAKAAVCYGFQLLDEIPSDDHDIPVDAIITPGTELFR